MKKTNNELDEGLLFSVQLLISHPNIDPAEISKELSMTPQHWALAGSQRYTPKGTMLHGVHQRSSWSHSQDVFDKRHFFEDVMKIVDMLEPHRAFISKIRKEGGKVSINLHLPGSDNIGDSIEPPDLHKISDLGISLGIEVFPDMH